MANQTNNTTDHEQRKELLSFYRTMNEMTFQLEVKICNCAMMCIGHKEAQQQLGLVFETYIQIEKQIQAQLDNLDLDPIQGKGQDPMEKWDHFKTHCINQMQLSKGLPEHIIYPKPR